MKITDKNYYMDGILKTNLDLAKKTIKKDWDMIFVADGGEGSGKSVCIMQCAYYCDPTLTLDRVTFTPEEFQTAILNAEPYQAVIYDEAYTGLSSRATMSLINRTLISMLAEIRQKNLFVFVVMPCFFDLDKYVALWRSRALIHIYTAKNFERGYFAFYNVDKKKDLYISGKKFYSYSNPKPNFIGRFTNFYPVDEQDYRKKKRDSLINKKSYDQEKEVSKEAQDVIFQRLMQIEDKIPIKVKLKLLDVCEMTYYRKLKEYRENKGVS